MITKRFLALIILGSFFLLPLRAVADPPPTHGNNLYRSLESGSPSRPAARVSGVVESVDYSSGTLVVRSGSHSAVVAIVPSTTVYAGSGYGGISDLRRGQRVDISVYEIDGRLVAQVIRLK